MQAKKGDTVSLVLVRRIFFFQGRGGLNLGIDGIGSGVIPETVTDKMLNQINIALENGHLTLGTPEERVEIPDRDSDMRKMLESGRNKINDWVSKLLSDKSVTKSEKLAILEKLVEFERSGKNRKSVAVCTENAMKTIGGISPVTEAEQEKIEIKLTSGTEEEQIEK